MPSNQDAALAAAPRNTSANGFLALALAAALLPPTPAAAQSTPVGTGAITIEQPWARATPGGAKLGAGYLVIRNDADAPDRLIGIEAEPAGRVSAHSMRMVNGVMTMRPLPEVVVPAHGTVSFNPGGDHLMLEELKRPLKKGDSFVASLTFEKAGTVGATFEVEAIGAQGPAGAAPKAMPGMDMN